MSKYTCWIKGDIDDVDYDIKAQYAFEAAVFFAESRQSKPNEVLYIYVQAETEEDAKLFRVIFSCETSEIEE